MREYALAIDPGMSTGLCLFSYGDEQDEPFRQERLWQFRGGAASIRKFLTYTDTRPIGGALYMGIPPLGVPGSGTIRLSRLVVEKFTPRPHETFSLTQDSVEPLRGEGVLIGLGLEEFIDWREPSQQYFMGGATLAEKKKRSREFLKLNGIYATGKTVGQPDADDAISAELHAIAWLRKKRHMPTLVELFTPEKEA